MPHHGCARWPTKPSSAATSSGRVLPRVLCDARARRGARHHSASSHGTARLAAAVGLRELHHSTRALHPGNGRGLPVWRRLGL
eukprot:6607475-Prymnesium_polylepis.1